MVTYLWVRTDLPLADQMVQAAHAAQAAGAKWPVPPGCGLVLLAVSDKAGLAALERCAQAGIGTIRFHEPDQTGPGTGPMGHTALCSEPVPRSARRWFRNYRLWPG